jgi:hypothetical protein
MRPYCATVAPYRVEKGMGFSQLSGFGSISSRGAVTTGSNAVMAVKFLKQLLATFCRHQFSWPHSGVHGQDYQVCLVCGTVYEYDWVTMRRTRRLPSSLYGRVEFKSRPGHGE